MITFYCKLVFLLFQYFVCMANIMYKLLLILFSLHNSCRHCWHNRVIVCQGRLLQRKVPQKAQCNQIEENNVVRHPTIMLQVSNTVDLPFHGCLNITFSLSDNKPQNCTCVYAHNEQFKGLLRSFSCSLLKSREIFSYTHAVFSLLQFATLASLEFLGIFLFFLPIKSQMRVLKKQVFTEPCLSFKKLCFLVWLSVAVRRHYFVNIASGAKVLWSEILARRV